MTDKVEYEIVAVFKTVVYTDTDAAFKYYQFVDAETPEQFDEYIAKCKELSLYDTGVTAEYGDKLITLSTCEYSCTNGRMVVVAKMVTEGGGNDEFYFRDYLIQHSEVAKEYEKLKLNLWKKFEHNRDEYTNAKAKSVKQYTEKAKND